jgi:antitoxin component of RelBE/YafQ-DinJ toxin-antitoxin module
MKHQFAFRIDPKLRDDFHAAAKAKGLKASAYVRMLMIEAVKKFKKEQK